MGNSSGFSSGKDKSQVQRARTHPGLPPERTLALVDYFLFLLDSRIPTTSLVLAEPYLRKRKRVYVLTKPDLADPVVTAQWLQYFQGQNVPAFQVNCSNGQGLDKLLGFIREKKKELDQKSMEKVDSYYRSPIRLMLFGLPNVGKSSLANRLLGVRKAPFGAKPGLTRSANWLKGRDFLEILDTPGVLDTSQVDQYTRLKLAATWALPENAYDPQDVALFLAETIFQSEDHLELLREFGRSRGFLGKGGEVDMDRTCKSFIKAFREGDLGRISLEKPPSEYSSHAM